jgi:hypothetical protein
MPTHPFISLGRYLSIFPPKLRPNGRSEWHIFVADWLDIVSKTSHLN